ncbi:hypothetical protein Tco_0418226 [Tanacetum coccineum]
MGSRFRRDNLNHKKRDYKKSAFKIDEGLMSLRGIRSEELTTIPQLQIKEARKVLMTFGLYVAQTGFSSRQTSSYYVTHPTSMVDYDDEYQQDDVYNNSEDPLVSAMLLLAKAITQNFSNPTNNRLRASSNTRNQAIIQGTG